MLDCDVLITSCWREQALPQPACDFLNKWEQIAREDMKTYRFEWPAKLVHTDFRYNGLSYRIVPETFGIPYDLCEKYQQGPWVRKVHGGGFDDDLRAIPGVSNVFSDGFLD